VNGQVLDIETNAPVSDAFCLLHTPTIGYASPTDFNGFFSFQGVEPGTYTLECESPNHRTSRMSVTVLANSGTINLGAVRLELNPCTAINPPCSDHGVCAADGESCLCDDGWQGIDCSESILADECANHRGFTEDVLNSVIIRSAIHKSMLKLESLLDQLTEVENELPDYDANSCCGADSSPPYPVEVTTVSSSSYNFLQELISFNEDSEDFLSFLSSN